MIKFRKYLLMLIDIALFAAVAIFTRFIAVATSDPPPSVTELLYLANAAIFLACIMVARIAFRSYSNVWRYANSKLYLNIVLADLIGGVVALFIS